MTACDLLAEALLPESIQACIEDLLPRLAAASPREALELIADIAELTNLRRHMLDPMNAPAHEIARMRKQKTSGQCPPTLAD